MKLKMFKGFQKLAIITVAISGFGVTANWTVTAGPLDQLLPGHKPYKQHSVVVAQSETRTTAEEKTAPPSESAGSESKTQEKKELPGAKEKPLKEFRPSERIEAEQAVDFPYDI